jgi:hypothetical protein
MSTMDHNSDEENETHITIHDEETPLLADNQSGQQPDQDQEQHEQKQSTWRWYAWRIFWIIIAALILTLFIKGWIDAGADVNVGATD